MHVWLQVSEGQAVGQKFHLRSGQLARFGRSDWADFSFPDDFAMDEIQFEVRVDQQGPRLRNNGRQTATLVNGTAVQEHALKHGDVVAAGETTFAVVIEGQPLESQSASEAASEAAPLDPFRSPQDIAALAAYLELEEAPLALAGRSQSPQAYVEGLKAHGEWAAATRVQAHFLPKPQAVRWGAVCLREVGGNTLTRESTIVLTAAEKWANEPVDEHRLTAGRMAEAAYFDGPAAMLALGAFCSGGNIGHPDHQPVLADDRITGKCVATALLQTAYLNDPSKSEQRYKAFLDHELAQPAAVGGDPPN